MLYLAFLRGINVSGQKIIKMYELARHIEGLGFTNVKTFLASGNVAFECGSKSGAVVTKKIETELKQTLGYEVMVMLRTMDELAELVARDPFKKTKALQATRYVTFFRTAPEVATKFPLRSPKKNVEVISIIDRDAFSLSTTIPNGDYPNPFLEKLFGIPATTRNWNTIEKIVQSLS